MVCQDPSKRQCILRQLTLLFEEIIIHNCESSLPGVSPGMARAGFPGSWVVCVERPAWEHWGLNLRWQVGFRNCMEHQDEGKAQGCLELGRQVCRQ